MRGNKGGRPTVEISSVNEPGSGHHPGAPWNDASRDKAKKTSNVAVPVAAAVPEMMSGGAPRPRPSEPLPGAHNQTAAYYSHHPSGGGSVAPPTYLPKIGGGGGPGGNSAPDPARPGESTTTIDTVEHPDGSKTVTTVTRTMQPDGSVVEDVITSTTPPPAPVPGAHAGGAHDPMMMHQQAMAQHGMAPAYDPAYHQPPPPVSDASGSFIGGGQQQQQLHYQTPPGSAIGGGSAISGVSGGVQQQPPPPPPDIVYRPPGGAPAANAAQQVQTASDKPPAPEKKGWCADKKNRTIAIVAAVAVVVLGGVGAALGVVFGRGDGGEAATGADETPSPPFDPPVIDPTPVGPGDPTEGEPSICAVRTDGESFCANIPGQPFSLCGDADDFQQQCSFWFKSDDPGQEDQCCGACQFCPPGCSVPVRYDCTNVISTLPAANCGVCPNENSETTTPPIPQTTSSSIEYGGEGDSVCAKFGGENLFCQGLDEEDGGGDLEFCLERSPDESQCNLWLTDTSSNTDICCKGCTVCPAGCNNTIALDCSNLGGDLIAGCGCEGEANSFSTRRRKRRDLGSKHKKRVHDNPNAVKLGKDTKLYHALKLWLNGNL